MAMVSLGLMGSLILFTFVVYISFNLPEVAPLEDYSPPIPSQVLSKDGEVLLEIGIENRELVPIDQIPTKVVNSFLAAEDDNFYEHNGVDYLGVVRAMLANIRAGRVVQGGSTITQQVAKQLLLSKERSITRKIKDFLLAQRIEEKFTKEEILYLYLNQVYLGGGYYGVKAAAHGYFDKELSEITVAQSALLAGLLVAPGKYSPYVNPKYAKIRQQYVLRRLKDTGKITVEQYKEALKEDIQMRIRKRKGIQAGYFTDWIRQKVTELIGEERLFRDGFEIITTLDWKLQKKAEEAVISGVKDLDKRQGFKGPIGHIDIEKDLVKMAEDFRKRMYKRESSFFIFNTDGTATYEYLFADSEEDRRKALREEQKKQEEENEEILIITEGQLEPEVPDRITELTKLAEYREEISSTVDKKYEKYFVPGNWDEDKFIDFIKTDEEYVATVVAVSNSQRMIYVSVGGIRAAIPYEHFRWAHERDVQEKRIYHSYVTNPTTIVKTGDQVLIKIIGKNQKIWRYVHSDFQKMNLADDFLKKFQAQKYFIASLEQEPEAQGALLSIDPFSGEIISLVGGTNFAKSQFNRILQSNRQPGSAFKPILFAVGLENGFTPSSIILDSPQALGGAEEGLNWKPRNYDGKFQGQMTFRTALEKSRNIPTIKLVQEVGVQRFIDFVSRVGLDVDLPKDLSISLGSFGVNMTNLVKAYAIFPNGGRRLKLKSILSIKDRFGGIYSFENKDESEEKPVEPEGGKLAEEVKVTESPVEGAEVATDITQVEDKPAVNPYLINLDKDQVYDERLAYIMTNLMKGVIKHGTGKSTRNISSFIGGKTGTTNSYVDAWFVGFSSNLVTGVWTGFDDNKTLGWAETGAKSALPIWREFMEAGIARRGERDFPIPEGIINVLIDKGTGRLANSNTTDPFMESFVEATEPGAEEVSEDLDEIKENPGQIILEDEDYYADQ